MSLRDFGPNELMFLLLATRWTILLALITFVGGGVLGLVVAAIRVAPAKPLRWLAIGYIQFFMGTPILIQLFMIYYGSSFLGYRPDVWFAAALTFCLNAGAFFGEIFRGSIEAIPKGQWEASTALGFRFLRTLAAGHRPAGRAADAAADGRLHGADREDDVGGVADRSDRTRARRDAGEHHHLPAGDGVRHRVADLFRAVLAAVALRRLPRAPLRGRSDAQGRAAGDVGRLIYLTLENAVGCRNELLMLATICPSFSLSLRAAIHSGSAMNAPHRFSRSARDSQASR